VQLNRYTQQHLLLRSRCACVISSCGLICNRWSALLVVFHLGGKPSYGYIDSSQIESLGGEKTEVSNAPTATPQTAGLRSPFQWSVVPQFGQK
jgi:hypothetical protein